MSKNTEPTSASSTVSFEDQIRSVWRYLKERGHASDEYAENEVVYWLVGLKDPVGPNDCDEMRARVRAVLRQNAVRKEWTSPTRSCTGCNLPVELEENS